MSEKLTQEELTEVIKTWRCDLSIFAKKTRGVSPWENRDEQAYNQIKEIVEEHFKRKDFTKGYEIKQIRQTPTVTELQARNLFSSDAFGEFLERLNEYGMEVLDD